MDWNEKIYQGYCRSSDQSRMVICEYHIEDEKNIMDHVDCAYGACVHSNVCELIKGLKCELHLSDEG